MVGDDDDDEYDDYVDDNDGSRLHCSSLADRLTLQSIPPVETVSFRTL